MLRAYIIKSRVCTAETLLMVQPYSPELFRLGDLLGPQSPMKVVSGDLAPEDAKKEWEKDNIQETYKAQSLARRHADPLLNAHRQKSGIRDMRISV